MIGMLLCAGDSHRWHLMTSGRAGFVRWYRCKRGCGARKMVKGSEDRFVLMASVRVVASRLQRMAAGYFG